MAELIVAIASLTGAVGQLYSKEQKDRKGVELGNIETRMRSIRSELLAIQSFLNQVDMRNGDDQGVDCVDSCKADVLTLANSTQDLADDFIHFVSYEQGYKFGDITRKIVRNDRILIAWTEIDSQLNNIETGITRLSEMKERWIQMPTQTSKRPAHQASEAHFLDEEELVGIEENREILTKLLQSDESALSVVSVWGMGGLGKTALVANVYKRESPNFDCHGWITILQSYNIDDILRILVMKLYPEDGVPDGIQSTGIIKLKEILRRFLKDKRYLIILDNIWNPKAFHDLCDCLVDNQQRSRIIITTRNDDVASLAHDGCKLQIKPLDDNKARDLFWQKAFRKAKDHVCPSEIEKCAKEIVTKCQGLPLAIVSVGRLMSPGQQTESEWTRFLRQFNWELEHNSRLEDLRKGLYLSYMDLPIYLKNCFLYCSMFPEDYLLSKKRLIRLWIAEGFVEEREDSTLEEVAEDSLKQLVKRNILQVVEKKFRLHHLMRQLALYLSRKTSFHTVYNYATATSKVDDKARRLAVHKCSKDMSSINLSLLRTFLAIDSTTFPSSNLSKSKYLRVLDLEGAEIETVTDEIFDLFNLRYLSLRNSNVTSVPESIEKLYNLEMLDLFGSRIEGLPRGIVKLKKLRYLNVLDVTPTPPKAPKGSSDMENLQTLKGIRASKNLVEGLKSMNQLRSLIIWELKDYHFMQLTTALSQMHLLSRLSLSIKYNKHELLTYGREFLFYDGWLPNLRSLRELHLKGGNVIKKDPEPSPSRLLEKVKYIFQDLYEREQLVFRAGWLRNLQSLIIEDMSCVNRVKMEQRTMINLHTLVLKDLQEVKQVPEGIEFLPSLKNINFSKSHPELKARLQESDMQSKLQHIPNIYID